MNFRLTFLAYMLLLPLIRGEQISNTGGHGDITANGNQPIRAETNQTLSAAEAERLTGLPSPNDVFVIAVTHHHKDLKDYFTSESLLQALPKLVPADVRFPAGDKIFWQSGVIVLKDKTVLFWRTCGDWFIAVDWAEGTSFYAMPGAGVRVETTNSFGIYLPSEPVDRRITAQGKGDWSHIRLSESPLISANDIVSYDFENHSIKLTSDAVARIPRTPVEGTPFIVVADGQRIYLGVFTTCESSMSFAMPCITVDRRILVTNQSPDTLVIERAYPQPSFGVGPDPRGDPRIKTALAALRKLTGSIMATGGNQPIRAETMTGRPTAEIGVLDLNPPVRVMGCLGKPLGTRMVIDGVFAEHAIMLANPLAVTRIDGQPFKDGVSIEIRSKLQIHKGVHYRLEGYEAGEFTGYPSWQAPEAQQPFQYRSCFVVSEIIEPKPAEDGALIASQFDPIEALARELNSNALWPNGEAPNISLSSNAAPKEVVTRAVEMWGFDGGHIKTYQILEVRQIRLDAMPGCSAALIESDLGKKILLFRYEQHDKTNLWWKRFYNAPEEAESNHAANAVQPRFALYLVKVHHAEVAKTELDNEPLLSEQDIVSYDWQTHTMTLTESGEKKIPQMKAVGTFGKEFIVVADGQRCYRGAFWCSFSSVGYNNPIIDVANGGRTVQIQRAYPSAKFATGDDPRPDKRIHQVLEALGKLEDAEPSGASTGSQPIRSETNRTSSAAGFRR